VLEVIATDRGALVDIPAWAGATGHHVLEVRDEPDQLVFLVEN
jgi:tRNA 2-thiouridine synthesizing protein A